jgi:hypothetical protein
VRSTSVLYSCAAPLRIWPFPCCIDRHLRLDDRRRHPAGQTALTCDRPRTPSDRTFFTQRACDSATPPSHTGYSCCNPLSGASPTTVHRRSHGSRNLSLPRCRAARPFSLPSISGWKAPGRLISGRSAKGLA